MAGPRPRIGITTDDEPASWSYRREVPAAVVPSAYIDSVRAADGMPYLLAPVPEIAEDSHEVIASLHALVVVGGSDIAPGRYGQSPHSAGLHIHEIRDEVELALIQGALEADLDGVGVTLFRALVRHAAHRQTQRSVNELAREFTH